MSWAVTIILSCCGTGSLLCCSAGYSVLIKRHYVLLYNSISMISYATICCGMMALITQYVVVAALVAWCDNCSVMPELGVHYSTLPSYGA